MGTVIIHIVLLLLLVLVGFSMPPPPEMEEGILVNFGTDETGSGFLEPSPAVVEEEASLPQPESVSENQTEEPILTQDFEEAPEIKKVDPEAERKKQEKIEADKKLREQLEAERVRKEQEEIERLRVEAEKKRQADIMDRTKNALANAKNTGSNSTSEGITGGEGNQGDPSGSVESTNRGEGNGLGDKGISYDLQGRGFQTLPSPKYTYQGEGRVVVEVSVDRSGKVVSAVAGVKGSTTLDDYLLRVSKDAAMAARFESKPDAPMVQKGTITYNFKLR